MGADRDMSLGREAAIERPLEVSVPIGRIDWDLAASQMSDITDDITEELELGLAAIEVSLREKFADLDLRLLFDGRRLTPWEPA